jgi:PDGLE domain
MRTRSVRLFCVLVFALAVGLGTGVSPFASSSPDGLERVAEDEAFLDQGRPAPVQEDAPLPDYAFPGVGDPRLATGLAGFAGTLAVFAAGWGAAAIARGGRRPPSALRAPADEAAA